MPTPAKRAEWVTGADADGALLVRDPLVENRTITLRLILLPAASMNAALLAIEDLSQKLEECEQNDDGLGLVWTPANSTTGAITFYVLSGTVTNIPITMSGDDAGWFQKSPVVNVTLTCKPFGYEAEVLFGSSTTDTKPLITLALTSIPGDVPAEGRLIVTDNASQSRAHVEWGLEQRNYNAGTPADLLVDSDSMSVTGFAGTQTTRTGAYDPGAAGNNVIRATLATSASAVCSTGNLAHIGTFRCKLRCYCTSTDVQVRLAWKDGDSPYSRNDYAQAVTVGWNDLDLGLVNVPVARLGTQRWVGLFEAYSPTSGDTIDVDVLQMVPAAEGYGKGRSPVDVTTVATYSALDDFNQTAGNLTGKTLGVGGTWQGAGDADDFVLDTGNHYALRTVANDVATGLATGRVVTASTPTSLTNTVVAARVFYPTPDAARNTGVQMGVVARYTNISNLMAGYVEVGSSATNTCTVAVVKSVAGVGTVLSSASVMLPTLDLRLALVVLASGVGYFTVTGQVGGDVIARVVFSDSSLATAGALASGTVGMYDRNSTATTFTRTYDGFQAFAPVLDNVVWSGQSAEFRYDGSLREDSSGVYYGPVQTYRGGRFLIPPAGDTGRTSRVAVKARRNDVDTQPDDSIADSTKIEVRYRARHLNVRGS